MATDKDTRVKAIAYMRSLIRKNVREDGGASPHSPMGQRSRSGSDPNENDTKLDMFRNHNSNNTWSGTSNSDKYPSIQSSLFDDPSQGANGGFRSNSLGGEKNVLNDSNPSPPPNSNFSSQVPGAPPRDA